MDSPPQSSPGEHEVAIRTADQNGQTSTKAARSTHTGSNSDMAGIRLVTSRFKHVVTEGEHAIVTGRDTVTRCEDEPIHIPGAVQGFGALIAFDQREGLLIRVVSENSQKILGYTPDQLFALESFTSILSEEQTANFLEHLDYVQNDADVATSGPEVFSLSISSPTKDELKLWCAMHINDSQPHLIICEFELEDDRIHPPGGGVVAESMESTLGSDPTEEDWLASTQSASKPLRLLRGARKQQSTASAALEVSKVITQVQDQLGAQSTLQGLLDVLVGLVRDITSFHRVMVYQFDSLFNGQVVAELLDPRTTKDLYKGLHFPAADIPRQARDLYKVNKVRLLYDRDQETARLVCRATEDLLSPLDLTHSYLRAMSPIHSQYLRNMAVRSSLSISITAFGGLWGLITCHSYGSKGLRVSFPTRDICRIIGDTTSRNIERLSYASRLQMRSFINTVPTKKNPSGYITASSEDLLSLFHANFGGLMIRDELKMLGKVGEVEALHEFNAIVAYLRKRNVTKVTTSSKIGEDFPDLHYPQGFHFIGGLLLVPLSSRGQDFVVFFRRSQSREVKWAGNPHEKHTEGHLMPRTSFKTWSETVTGSKEWAEEELEAAAVLCLVYGKFIEVWRQKEAVLQNSQITRLLLANSAHEVRTPLNAIVNYLEIALEGALDEETRDNLAKSHDASKSLIYVINDLLDLTASVEGGDFVQNETFDIRDVLLQATGAFSKDAQRKQISYQVIMQADPGLPSKVIGDARRLRQAISNLVANAVDNTASGGVRVDVASHYLHADKVEVEICVSDTGVGMNAQKVRGILSEFAQVESEDRGALDDTTATARKALIDSVDAGEDRTLGLGLAVVARIVYNMRGQLRVKSDENQGTRFVLVFTFGLPESRTESDTSVAIAKPGAASSDGLQSGATTPSNIEEEIMLIGSGERSVSREDKANGGPPGSGFALDINSKNNANRLIEAMQQPNQIEGWSVSHESNDASASRPNMETEHITEVVEGDNLSKPKDPDLKATISLEHQQLSPASRATTTDEQGQSSKASHIPVQSGSSAVQASPNTACASGEAKDGPSSTVQAPTAQRMRVLVAEDDMVNSRIIEKRLKKAGCEVRLTSNGEECAYAYCEECAYAYCEETGRFDIILMDIQVRSNIPHSLSLTPGRILITSADANHGRLHFNQNDSLFRIVRSSGKRIRGQYSFAQALHSYHRRLGFTGRKRVRFLF